MVESKNAGDGRRVVLSPHGAPLELAPADASNRYAVPTSEPALATGALGVVVTTIAGFLVYYGLNVPPDFATEFVGLMTALAALWPILTARLRRKVTPVEKAEALIAIAHRQDPATTRPPAL